MQTYYVDPTAGHDANPGSMRAPFATLGRAQASMRSHRGGAVAILRTGTYLLGAQGALALDARDRGQVWQAAPGETPVLSGGVDLAGQASYDAASGQWALPLPSSWAPRALYVAGVHYPQPYRTVGIQLPAAGMDARCCYLPPGTVTGLRNPLDVELLWRASPYPLVFTETRLPIVYALPGDTLYPAPLGRQVMLTEIFTYGHQAYPAAAPPNYLVGARDWLAPGQCASDRYGGRVWFRPLPQHDGTEDPLVVPRLATLVGVRGAADVTLSGLVFSHSHWGWLANPQWGFVERQTTMYWDNVLATYVPSAAFPQIPAALDVAQSTGIEVTGCQFRDLGTAGLALRDGAADCAATGNLFRDLAATAVYLGDMRYPAGTLPATRCTLANNCIHDMGAELQAGAGIVILRATQSTVSQNTIYNGNYIGIEVGFSFGTVTTVPEHDFAGNRVTRNLIHDCMAVMEDGAGIYCNGFGDGTLVAGNVIRDLPPGPGRRTRHGIYLDQGTRGVTYDQNLVYRAGTETYFVNAPGGRNRAWRTAADVPAITNTGQIVQDQAGPSQLDMPIQTNIPDTLALRWGAGLDAAHQYLLSM